MRLSRKSLSCTAAVLTLALVSACSQPASVPKKSMNSEESLECAALLFAVNNLMEIDESNADAVAVKNDAMAGLVAFGTNYAEAKGVSSDEVLGLAKIKAYRMLGKLSGGERLSDSVIVKRGKECLS